MKWVGVPQGAGGGGGVGKRTVRRHSGSSAVTVSVEYCSCAGDVGIIDPSASAVWWRASGEYLLERCLLISSHLISHNDAETTHIISLSSLVCSLALP